MSSRATARFGLEYFTLIDYVTIAAVAALGIAVKTIITPLVQIVSGPLFIPGGAIAGGFYMLFLILGFGIVKKPGTALLIALVQALVVFIAPTPASHGLASFITYLAPGLAVEALYLILRSASWSLLGCFLGGMIANIAGTFAVNMVLFRLPLIPLLLSLCSAALSGALGGWIASMILVRLQDLKIISES
ncbi:MAG: ECF transporter S component [Actinomycetia bacterium]|nr:ECF transporter S component [Actinomycetes bacterium]